MCLIINSGSQSLKTRRHAPIRSLCKLPVQKVMEYRIQESYPERKLQILSSPDLHAHVVSAQILKVGLADGK